MGYGDDVMGSGLARGYAARGKRIAFGDGKKIIFGPWSEEVFRHNPNIAWPGSEHASDIEWFAFYKGHRIYTELAGDHWVWNYNWKAVPGEMYFTEAEFIAAERVGRNFVVIEPNVPWQKSVSVNKNWGLQNYQEVANQLLKDGIDVVQFAHGRDRLAGVRSVATKGYRDALAMLERADLAIVPEGGLHHGAAAVNTRAVVIFGGYVSPQVTGYNIHANLTGGETHFCGNLYRCDHCRQAMERITPEQVYEAATRMLHHDVLAEIAYAK